MCSTTAVSCLPGSSAGSPAAAEKRSFFSCDGRNPVCGSAWRDLGVVCGPERTSLFQAELEARIVESMEDGLRLVEFNDESLIEKAGQVPLPPYIHETLQDPERYQTVYAKRMGSAAAPTAGLHFTERLMQDLRAKGVQTAFLTLHVGLDTFRPVEEDDPREHKLHTEYWEVSPQAAESINSARQEGRRVVAVGSTSVRVLEQTALLMEEQGRDAIQPWFRTGPISSYCPGHQVPCGGRHDHQLPPAAFHPAHACLRLRRP